MKKFLFITVLCFISSLKAQEKTIPIFEDFDNFSEAYFSKYDDTIRLFNFWATWCSPCVKELPLLELVNEKYKNKKFRLYLVSLDFKENLDSRLIPMIQSKGLKSQVIILDDPKANNWIDKVSPKWSGTIPATYVEFGKMNKFYEGNFESLKEIETILQKFFNN